jgi:hypothetical protein
MSSRLRNLRAFRKQFDEELQPGTRTCEELALEPFSVVVDGHFVEIEKDGADKGLEQTSQLL